MKSFIISLAVAVLASQSLSAQNTVSDTVKTDSLHFKNSWYIEFGGIRPLGVTINYERFLEGHPWGISVHAGIGGGIIPDIFTNDLNVYATIPIGISYNIPVSANKRSMIEVGGTYTYAPGLGEALWGVHQNNSFLQAVVSWRYESRSHTTQFRATLYPIVVNFSNGLNSLRPSLGFSIGKKF
ncbi:MAG TPA: hypothetical protein VHC47_13320 [Mucilaginibacter sp.]|nr:hypothetical protein [Mucilaginibacter sp.]